MSIVYLSIFLALYKKKGEPCGPATTSDRSRFWGGCMGCMVDLQCIAPIYGSPREISRTRQTITMRKFPGEPKRVPGVRGWRTLSPLVGGRSEGAVAWHYP